jgi:hypothetical protein
VVRHPQGTKTACPSTLAKREVFDDGEISGVSSRRGSHLVNQSGVLVMRCVCDGGGRLTAGCVPNGVRIDQIITCTMNATIANVPSPHHTDRKQN